ncbi:YtxH-like protein [Caloramator quimbayensis]|uniref:YtxH-like protein n=1 Tax=Caloramator quimbayensis TaxID=1147123 RepID=A0A1T4XJ55_9CLOT|nr:YtxH domain-containing protein [Caloramator quimbayensis]SKA89443.1 YtxH-like protein [Caloramator quimbayensis]
MRGRFVSGLTAGMLLGAAAGLMMMPQMDMRTRRKVSRASNRIIHRAEALLNDLREYSM